MSYTAKSVILDIADNWGDTNYLGLRSVDFWYDGSKISLADTDFTAYETSRVSANYHAYNVFDTSLSKTGSAYDTTWYSAGGSTTNQRLIVVFDSSQTFDEIRINNDHGSGTGTDRGAKNVVIHYSTDSITDTTYEASITNSTQIFDGQFDEHVAEDAEDEQILTLSGGDPLPDEYTVTYNGNGNTSGSVPVDATNYEDGDTVTVLGNTGSLVKTNNSFSGWNTASDGSGTNYNADDTFVITGDITLYAVWKQYVVLINSTNIAASSADTTTAQLTAPTGKTTADFQAGYISDDTNPVLAIDLGEDKYTEVEFSVEIDAVSDADELEFRIASGGTVLDTYSFIPLIEVAGGEPPGPGVIQALAIDGFAFSDITTRRATYRAAAFDSASFAELDQRYAIFHKDAADGLSMLDAALRNLLMSASSSDNATFADSATIQALLQALSQDSIDLSDTATGDTSSAILALASDSIAFQSSAAVRASLAAILEETISVADTVAAIGAFFATVQESISIADLSTLDSAITAIAGDNVTLSDSSARTLRAFLLSADTINVSDDGSVRAHFSLSVSDTAHLSETVSAIGRFYAMAVDAAGFSENATGINTTFLPKGVVSISFCVKQATFTFTIKQPGFVASAKNPSAGFSVRASETSGDDKCRL